jgi:rod shape-determining protein MreC
VPRNRTARLAVLGSPVPRSRPTGYSSRSATAVKRRLVAGVLVLLSLALITIYFREPAGGGLHNVQSVGATVLRPFEVAAERVARPFRDGYGYFAGLIHAKSQNADLRDQVEKLSQQAIQNANAAAENADLKRQLGYVRSRDFPKDYDYVAATVITRPASEFEQQIVIDAGASKGIRLHDPVVTAAGLVGLVTRVAHNTAQITLLTDPNLQVSALDLQTGAAGVVRHGQGRDTLAFTRVKKSQLLSEGDLVETQGWHTKRLTSLYPKGIPIGVVTGASQSEVDLYWQAQVIPRVDFDSLQFVLVLTPKLRGAR